MQELVVEAVVDNLGKVTEFVTSALTELEVAPKIEMQLELVVEEVFVNIASYAYEDKVGTAVIRRELVDGKELFLTFIDEGVPYDPLLKEEPNTSLPIEERSVGGLGIFLVKKNVDTISYEYKDGKNCLHIKKNLFPSVNIIERG